jgi:hypothetical protein
MRYLTPLLFAGAAALAISCGSPTGLGAYRTNTVDTVSMFALTGTPVSAPSGFSILNGAPIRTDVALAFDFAFDIDSAGRAKFLPTGALKLGEATGLQISTQIFDSIKIAPTTGYQLDSAVFVHDSTVVIAHSNPNDCVTTIGYQAPYYAKFRILTIDTTSGPNGRRIDFEILADRNCGFRGLEPGLPKN